MMITGCHFELLKLYQENPTFLVASQRDRIYRGNNIGKGRLTNRKRGELNPASTGPFFKTTKINQINHRCIQVGRRVLQTSRHRRMDIGAILAAD